MSRFMTLSTGDFSVRLDSAARARNRGNATGSRQPSKYGFGAAFRPRPDGAREAPPMIQSPRTDATGEVPAQVHCNRQSDEARASLPQPLITMDCAKVLLHQ